MAKDKLPKAQTGKNIPAPSVAKSMLDEGFMQERFGGYKPSSNVSDTRGFNVEGRSFSTPEPQGNPFEELMNKINSTPSGKGVGPVTRTADQYSGSDRYDFFNPDSGWDNEDAAAQGQSLGEQMVNGMAKGIVLTGTTLLQNTLGLVNGVFQAYSDGRLASFYDNPANRALDEVSKSMEDFFPNYYTKASRDAKFYSPDYWMTGNFLFDGVIKNMGFAAGTALSAGVYTNILKSIPLASKLFSVGKAGETLAATEAGLAGTSRSAGIFGELKTLSDKFLKVPNGYSSLNKGQQVLVSGLSTTGEAGFEALHNMNEFRQDLISKYREEKGVVPTGEDLNRINQLADKAGNTSLLANMAFLTGGNYITLPKIMGSSYGAEKTLLNGLGRKTKDIVFDEAGKASRKQVSKLRKVGNRVVNTIRKPYLFSYVEAAEESSQFGIGVATNDYYGKAYEGEATNWIESVGAGFTQGIFTDEGAKNALIGGLSGSIMMNVIPSARSLITGKETQKQKLSRQTDEAIKEFNSSSLPDAVKQMKFQLSNFTKESKDSINRGTVLQTEREASLKAGDIFTSKNLEADYIVNYLTPRIKYGRFDLVQSEINKYREIATGNFSQLQEDGVALPTDTKDAFLARLTRFEKTSEAAYSLYQSLNIRYGSEFIKDSNGDVIKTKNGKGVLKYPPSVMDKMLYTALKTEDFDDRILTLETKLAAVGINTSEVLKSVVNGNFEAYNEAVQQIKNLDKLQESKDKLGTYLDDIADSAAQRQMFIKTYKDIQDNPMKYLSEPIDVKETTGEEKETIKVKTDKGVIDVELETEYFVGNSIDYNEDGLDELFNIGTLIIKGYNKDGTLKIVDTKTGQERNLTRGTFNKLKLGRVSTTKNNITANYFYNHRNEIFELNRGKNFGGKIQGRIEYDNGKLFFVYKTKGKGVIKRKELNNSFFVRQKDSSGKVYESARITRVGKVQSKNQKISEQKFISPEEIAKTKQSLEKNRKARLDVLTQLGEEGKENIAELEKTITKSSEDLAKIKEDLSNIRKMKRSGPDGKKIKLNFSKATKSFTRTINRLTQMRKDLNKTIKLAESEREEVLNDISYFEQYTNEISDAPEDSGEFLKELKDQVKVLASNGKNLANIIKAAKKMGTTLRQVTKRAANLFKKAIKSTYIVDDTYAKSLNDLLSDVASGTDLEVTWPALKEEMVNFQLTNDISKDVNLEESDIENTVSELKELESDITELRNEYRARKIILDRFQSIMNEYNAQKAAQLKLQNDQNLLNRIFNTAIKSTPLKQFDTPYNPISLKSFKILPVATIPINEGKDHQIRANEFGENLDSFENRDDIRGIYLTNAIQEQLLPGVVEKMLDGDPDLIERYKDSIIIMVMVNENGELVGKDGQLIPEGKSLLDNAIYQSMPKKGLTNTKGSMFREGTDEAVVTLVKEQYDKFTEAVLNQTALGIPQEIEASFGSPELMQSGESTSAQDAGLITDVDLETKPLIYVPTSKGKVEMGTTGYDSPLGRVFLRLRNAYYPLRNRKLTNNEASVVFDSIVQLSKNIYEKGEGVESNSSIDILNFLKRTVYWGVPTNLQTNERKEPGKNSVFFQRVTPEDGGQLQYSQLQLVIGDNPNSKFDFDPTSLEMNRDVIVEVLESIYNNVNGYDKIINDLDAEFEQIIGVNNGEIESVIWPNYQSYLLSNQNPDGTKRKNFELPLSTIIKPKEEGKVNKKNIYFYSKTGMDNYEIPNPAVQKANTSPTQNAPTNIPIIDGKAVLKPSYDLTGETVNTFTFEDTGMEILFTFTREEGVTPNIDQIKIFEGGNLQEIVNSINVTSVTDPEAIRKKKSGVIRNFILNDVNNQIILENSENAYNELANKPTASIFNTPSPSPSPATAAAPVSRQPASLFGDTPAPTPKVAAKPTQQNSGASLNEESSLNTVVSSWLQTEEGSLDNQTAEESASKFALIYNRKNPTTKGDNRTVSQIIEGKKKLSKKERLEDAGQTGSDLFSTIAQGMEVRETILNEIKSQMLALESTQQTSEVKSITMQPDNISKILSGEKTTTLRANNLPSGVYNIGGQQFNLTNRGLLSIEEAGGVETISKSEAFAKSGPKFSSTKDFLAGRRKLYVYDISPTQQTSAPVKIVADTDLNIDDDIEDDIDDFISDMNDDHFREVIEQDMSLFEEENWKEVATWMKNNLPTVQLNRVKNIIQAGGGKLAWGMFKDNAVYIYDNAEVGTVYHEAFEAVFNQFLSVEEASNLQREFKARKGVFVDRPTGQEVKFSEATGQQMKEQLSEEFRDFILKKKAPKGFFARIFKALKDLIEKWFISPNSDNFTKELFNRIDTGFYASAEVKDVSDTRGYKIGDGTINDMLYAPNFESAEFREVVIPLTDRQAYDTLQEMTYQLVSDMIKNDDNLFNTNLLKGVEFETYNKLKKSIKSVVRQKVNALNSYVIASDKAKAEGKLYFEFGKGKKVKVLSPEKMSKINILRIQNKKLEKNILKSWPVLIERHKQYLQSFNISFDQGSQDQLDSNDRIRESNKFDASKIDNLKAASASLKLLLATLQVKNNEGKPIISSINGSILQPLSKSYITLISKLHNSTSPDDMMAKLKELSSQHPTYERLYTRITEMSTSDGGVSFDEVTMQKSRIITSMWRSFKKFAPEVINNYIFDDGATLGPAAYSSAADQLSRNYFNGIATAGKSEKGFFSYNKLKGKFIPRKQKIESFPVNTPLAISKFLQTLGISFPVSDIRKLYKKGKQEKIKTVVQKIKDSLIKVDEVTTFSKRSLDINRRIQELALLQVSVNNPDFDSTFRNVNGEQVQTFFGGNAADSLHVALENAKTKDDLANTNFSYILTDVFSQGSNLMSRLFASDGTKKELTEDLFKPGVSGGMVYDKKKNVSTTRFTDKERFIQSLNLNLDGRFLNLVPGDASLEHMLNMGKAVKPSELSDRGIQNVIDKIFKPYFISELLLSREGREIPKVEYPEGTPEFEKRKTTDLRFFKEILGETLHDEIVFQGGTPKEVYDIYKNKVDEAIIKYINTWVNKNQDYMNNFDMITTSPDKNTTYIVEGVDFPSNMKEDNFVRELRALAINYTVATIEMHKLLYSDPYQYTDELKRTKSFLSPRQVLVNSSPLFQAQQNNIWNEGYGKGDIGYYNFTRDHFRTATVEDVITVVDLPNYKPAEETDGAGIITFTAYRAMRINADNWNDAEEKQYRYDIAWEKRDKSIKLSLEEQTLLKERNPGVQSAYPDQKPIVSGNRLDKNGNRTTYNHVVLDKLSLYPLSYRIMKEMNAGNAIKLYNKMQRESIDYIVFRSARKVGADKVAHEVYNKEDSSFNEDEYTDIVNVPFSIMGIQSEVPSKEKAEVTRGSQPTKLITLDMFDNGVPVDFKQFLGSDELERLEQWESLTYEEKLEKSDIFEESESNTEILKALTEDAYERTLRRLGITENAEGEFEILDFSDATQTLRSELFKREVNDNISQALTNFLEKGTTLETTPVYQQVRNILYSIVNKELVKPKISGGLKTQIPSTFFESTKTKWNEKLKGYTSDTLDFYVDEDGKRVMEVMVGRWFKSDMNDKDLLEYLNKEENQSILEAFGFRTPTQAQNSIDVIRVARILPKEFSDNIVVPSNIVQKTGSDFDIDKLSIYLKNVFYRKGKLQEVPFFGAGIEAKREFAKMFDKGELLTSSQKKQLESLGQLKSWEIQGLINNEENNQGFGDLLALSPILKILTNQLGVVEQEDSLETFINELSEIGVRDAVINNLYKASLENAFIDSSRKLASNSYNFEKLITPNSAADLIAISRRVTAKLYGGSFNYSKVSNLLDNRFMLRLRQAFVTGKRAIGIIAVGQTGQSQNQKSPVTVDLDRLSEMSKEDQYWLGDGSIRFKNYNTYKGKASLSGVYDANGKKLISNVNSQLMDGYVDINKDAWIIEMGFTPQVAPTVLFLNSIGVPIDQIAFFVNQPIIKDYLLQLEKQGKRWIYNDKVLDSTLSSFGVKDTSLRGKSNFVIADAISLEDNLGKDKFSNQKQKDEQGAYLLEFLKYSRMASQYYTFTTGTNFDTAMLNDPFLIFKKQIQYYRALGSLISGAENRLASGFIKNMGERLGILPSERGNTRNALSNFLLSDRGKVRDVLENVLLPYVDKSDKEFVKIARSAVNSLFDWAMQNKGLNTQIQKVLLDDDGTASRVLDLINKVKNSKKGSPYFQLKHTFETINLEVLPSRRAGNLPNNLRISNVGTKAYDTNSIIYAFRELRTFLQNMDQADLYDDIVKLSVLQSGLGNSPISFTSYLPQEDVDKIYKYTLPLLENLSNLQDFADLNMFQRNNWSNKEIVRSDDLFLLYPKADNNVKKASYPSMANWARPPSVNQAFNKKQIPLTITQNVSNFKAGDDTMVFTWSDLKLSKSEKDKMRKQSDYSYIKRGLFKLVINNDLTPFVHESENKKKGTIDKYYIYKAINGLGDSFRSQEYYGNAKESIIDNGMINSKEVSDEVVRSAWEGSLNLVTPNLAGVDGAYLNVLNDGSILFADGQKYKSSEVNLELLEEIGYDSTAIMKIGKILKKKCRL